MADLIATTLAEVKEAVDTTLAANRTLEVRSAGTKRHLGRRLSADSVLDVSGLSASSITSRRSL